jgi:hypothetical protein
MSYGPYVSCQVGFASINLYSNAFDTITNDAVTVRDNSNVWTNLTSATVVHSDSRNVSGYGMRIERGGHGSFVRSSLYGRSASGGSGDVIL